MKNITLPCSKDHLYLIAKISWLTCHKYLKLFNHFNKAYNENFLTKCEFEIDMAQQHLDTRFLNSVGICETGFSEANDQIIYNRLKQLYRDAQVVFKNDTQVADQFNFDNILSIVTSI